MLEIVQCLLQYQLQIVAIIHRATRHKVITASRMVEEWVEMSKEASHRVVFSNNRIGLLTGLSDSHK